MNVLNTKSSVSHLQTSLYHSTSTYLYDLISLQTPRNTRSSSVVTLARPPTHSSLKITSRSFRYASPYLWNQLSHSLRQPRLDLPLSDSSLLHNHLTSRVSSSPLLSSITPSSSFPTSKRFSFSNPTLYRHLAPLRTDFTNIRTVLQFFDSFQFFLVSVIVISFLFSFCISRISSLP